MDPFGLIVVAGLIGYWIFGQDGNERAELRQAEHRSDLPGKASAEGSSVINQEPERETPRTCFPSASACFRSQYVSFTRLSTYCSCPQRFKLRYLDRHRATGGEAIFARGRAFHRGMQEYLSRFIDASPEMRFQSVFACMRKHIRVPIEQDWGFLIAKRVAERLREEAKFICRTFPKNAQVLAVEHELSFTLNGIRFFGLVDAVLRYPDGTVELVDYKTGQRLPKREQLELYSIPFEESVESNLRLRYLLTGRAYHHVWELNQEQRQAVNERICELVETIIDDAEFRPVIRSHCEKCGVRSKCPYYPQTHATYRCDTADAPPKLRTLRRKPPNESKYVHVESTEETDRILGLNPPATRRVYRGTSFRYRQAKQQYFCCRTGRAILAGQMHFVDHKSHRIEEAAFYAEFPEVFIELKQAWSVKRAATSRAVAPSKSANAESNATTRKFRMQARKRDDLMARIKRTDFASAGLAKKNFAGADLAGVDLSEVYLGGVNLRWADLTGAQLGSAWLADADLTGADLTYANLRGAILIDVTFREANLTDADLSYADLAGADLTGASRLADPPSGWIIEDGVLVRDHA